ncbi:hypothetical protein DQ04_02201020 [Trypanosoma grayi]|uniref:hypothetical protein n=1 Tax=Trypanosoma grayi TaxID=71804 RepID=UPI0004F4163F|nr:hypothetical protein DQ04_02201020 [Trypanosoma grayi]KEG11862.1 hypothetical protein DQ04_02201020 [Trypanosoma grayi]
MGSPLRAESPSFRSGELLGPAAAAATTVLGSATEGLGDTAARSGRKRHNVVVFPYFRDRLACDPQNFFCVHADYEFKWCDTAKEAERGVCVLIDAMVAAVRRAFKDALEYWQKLPASLQRAHALRAVTALPLTPLSNTLLHAQASTYMEGGGRQTMRKSIDAFSPLTSSGSPRARRSSSGSGGRNTHATASLGRAAGSREQREEDAVFANLLQQWEPAYNKPRCRIVLDIIASRKTLGDDPPHSEPYQLGQKAFRFAQTKYAAEVAAMFVGISDSSVTLVGRDILYPYRVTGGGPKTPGGNRATVRLTGGGAAAAAAALASSDTLNSAITGSTAALLSSLEQVLASTIPLPRVVALPPANTDKVDNVRLLVCFPSCDAVKDAV